MPDQRATSERSAETSPALAGGEVILRRSDEQVSIDWRGERLLMHIPSCTYCTLSATGARIWALLERSLSASQLCAELMADFGVDRERCVVEVLALARDLERRGLLTIDRS